MLLALLLAAAAATVPTHASPTGRSATSMSTPTVTVTEPDPSQAFAVKLGGTTFINKGLVAFGLIPSNATEFTGDTIGGIGSAIALASFAATGDGTYAGSLRVQPDRGFNVDGTIDYQARQHTLSFTLTPYYGAAPLTFAQAQGTLQLAYQHTVLYADRGGARTSGLDALGVRAAQAGFPQSASADPPLPIPGAGVDRLTLDLEGLVLNADGSFWVSDEYGPYVYRYSAAGALLQTVQPPDAILPMDGGKLNFTGDTDPDTGRAGNQGFEGLTVSADGATLYALLQSATIQDGGDKKKNARYTRLVAFDVSNASASAGRPALVGEWVVPLPLDSDSKTLGASELHFVSPGTFLALARDGDGRGGDDTSAAYKHADLISLSGATDIHGSKFDEPGNPLAKKGDLDKSITPATYVSFVDILNSSQLARFGLHNGDPDDETLIDAKWESLALASVADPAFPDDYFLFTASDNDFLSTHGVFNGTPFNAGEDVDNQFLVFRVTLPGAQVNV